MFLNSRNLIYSFSSKELYQFFNTLTHRNQTVLCFILIHQNREIIVIFLKVSIKIGWRSPCSIKNAHKILCMLHSYIACPQCKYIRLHRCGLFMRYGSLWGKPRLSATPSLSSIGKL